MMKQKNPVAWFEIYVNDMQRAQAFYEAVFDVQLSELVSPAEIEENMKMMAFPMHEGGEGAAGALVQMNGVQAGGNSTMVYFDSKDCSIEESRIESAGGKVFQPKHSLGSYGFMTIGIDTEGNMFGLHSMA